MQNQDRDKSYRPKKLNFEMIAKALGYHEHTFSTQLDVVLAFQREHGLNLKSDQPLDTIAQRASDLYFETVDQDGLLEIRASENTFELHTNGEPVKLGPLHRISVSKVGFYSFCYQDAEFLVVDLNGDHIVPMHCDVEDLYADAHEFDLLIHKGVEPIPPYADPASEHFAPELAMAIDLHNSLRVESEHNPNRDMLSRVRAWLAKNHPKRTFSDAMASRLSTIVGHKKKKEG